jgi:hypothetical protein
MAQPKNPGALKGSNGPVHLPAWTNNALVVALMVGAVTGWFNLSDKIQRLEIQVARIDQAMADGGIHAIISKIDKASSPQEIAKGMNLVINKVDLATAKVDKLTNQQITNLTPPVLASARRYPDVPQTWSVIAKLASYRTETLRPSPQTSPTPLPDCDVAQTPHKILAADIPEIPPDRSAPEAYSYGFVFRNCTLHLNHLPPGHVARTTLTGDVQLQYSHHAGEPITGGFFAFIIGCDIVLDNSGIAESPIIVFLVSKSRLLSEIDEVPPQSAQEFLLASLDTNTPSDFTVKLKSGM